jgi:hypothetical protein
MWEDSIVAEVRRVREGLARQFDFDVRAIFADLRKRQTALGSRLVRRGKRRKAQATPSPGPDSTALHPGR